MDETKEDVPTQSDNEEKDQVVMGESSRTKGWRAIDYMIANEYTNSYVQEWLDMPFIPTIRYDPLWRSFLNQKALKKEISESMALYKRVSIVIDQLRAEAVDSHVSLQDIVLFDVCSGKGNATAVLSFMFPNLSIYMVDKNKKMNISHVTNLNNVQIEYRDIFQVGKFVDWTNKVTQGKIGIFLGSHLCGDLSEIVIDVFNKCGNVRALILAPCCLSKRKRQIADTAVRLKIDNYMYWTRAELHPPIHSTISD
eukprot:TRINITY_DN7032_c0_g1_i1.p1 TRINITY_DN7032_c0_g1~~TRINITY_DN7032_c0_g1_i1.p1  ORF type:complete len:253 (+),score=40.89 TRINITY_DN7032_c0_g1_i1:3-761(+)